VHLHDVEAQWGYASRGKFGGPELYVVVNQSSLPLKAADAPSRHHNSPLRPAFAGGFEG
jgi:hypothetical protein